VEASTSWNPQGLSRLVQELLYFTLTFVVEEACLKILPPKYSVLYLKKYNGKISTNTIKQA